MRQRGLACEPIPPPFFSAQLIVRPPLSVSLSDPLEAPTASESALSPRALPGLLVPST